MKLKSILGSKKISVSHNALLATGTNGIYSCGDSALDSCINNYLHRKVSLETTLNWLIECSGLQLIETRDLFPLIYDVLKKAVWKKEEGPDCGDYDPKRPESRLYPVYDRYEIILSDIKLAENRLHKLDRPITLDNVRDISNNKFITAYIYQHRDAIKAKAAMLKARINSRDYTPLEAFEMVSDNWDVIYDVFTGYEAVEYCIVASINHVVPPYTDAFLRDYGYKMAPLFKKAKKEK